MAPNHKNHLNRQYSLTVEIVKGFFFEFNQCIQWIEIKCLLKSEKWKRRLYIHLCKTNLCNKALSFQKVKWALKIWQAGYIG